MCSHKLDEFVTAIRIDPNAVLKPHESCISKQHTQGVPCPPPAFAHVKCQDSPLAIPKSRLGDLILTREYGIKRTLTLWSESNGTSSALARCYHQSRSLEFADCLRDASIKLVPAMSRTVRVF